MPGAVSSLEAEMLFSWLDELLGFRFRVCFSFFGLKCFFVFVFVLVFGGGTERTPSRCVIVHVSG